MAEFRLDKTAFKINTFEEADASNVYGKNVSYTERLREAYYLISKVYGFSMDNQPKMDRTIFSCRKFLTNG